MLLFACGLLGAACGASQVDRLAIELSVIDQGVEHGDDVFVCLSLIVRPEEGGHQWLAEVQHRAAVPGVLSIAQETCEQQHKGTLVQLSRLRSFVNDAVAPAAGVNHARAGEAPEHGEGSQLASKIRAWNDRFFNMDTAETRQHAVLFHGHGLRGKHLAQEVSHFVMPKEWQASIEKRLVENREAFFGVEGAGTGGTTGANFLSGNVGFGNAQQGANLMGLLFNTTIAGDQASTLYDGDNYARRRGGNLFGESTSGDGVGASDLLKFEQRLRDIIMQRSDVHYNIGSDEADISFQFQHRLWRYGPNFDPRAKGGIWHKDTCPFGINGARPDGAIMFTLVYILYTENLDGPTAGTRVRDDSDGSVFELPCIAGEGNLIRTGEDDADAFFHSGPLNLRKVNTSRPAYRMMLQTKVVVQSRDGRRRTIPSTGDWRGLRIGGLAWDDGAPTAARVGALRSWSNKTSELLTVGVAASNALGFAAYPVNVHRAWSVARDLCAFLGFKSIGFLPEADEPATPVVVFGLDNRYTLQVASVLSGNGFRVLILGDNAELAELRRNDQDTYANSQLRNINDDVSELLENEPFDMHLVVDVPPIGTRAGDDPLIRYGDVLAILAKKAQGAGRIASVTVLSHQMPFAGNDTAGTGNLALGQVYDGSLSPTQKAYLKIEDAWVRFGVEHSMRVVVLRVADRVVAPRDNAMKRSLAGARPNPCRVEHCTETEPITRIASADLSNIVLRMISMFDIVEKHGSSPYMRGTASMLASLNRFPSGTVLEVVDEGPSDSMEETEVWARVMMGLTPVRKLCADVSAVCANLTEDREPEIGHRADRKRNEYLKRALGMPRLLYPTYREAGAKLYGSDEL